MAAKPVSKSKSAPPPPAKSAAAPSAAAAVRKPPLADDASVREVFADDFVGVYGIGPNFHLTFASRRPTGAQGALVRQVTSRLVLPLDAMVEMYNNLQTVVQRLEASGVVKARGGDKTSG
jgi:hypothetical protein